MLLACNVKFGRVPRQLQRRALVPEVKQQAEMLHLKLLHAAL